MKFKITAAISLISFLSLAAAADDQITICESDGTGTSSRIVFQPLRPGVYEALSMDYQRENVMSEPFSVFNHMGTILFRAYHGIEFHADENSDKFYVTVRTVPTELFSLFKKGKQIIIANPFRRKLVGRLKTRKSPISSHAAGSIASPSRIST